MGDGQLNLRLADLGGSNIWAMINALDVVSIDGSNIQSAGFARELVTLEVFWFEVPCELDLDSTASPTVFPDFRPVKENSLNLLSAELSASQQMPLQSANHEMHDQALTTLFDGSPERGFETSPFAWDSLVWDEILNELAV